MEERHSVRQYLDKSIEEDKRSILDEEIRLCNEESGLKIQAIYDEKNCFDSLMAKYGKLSGVANYIALVGKKGANLEEDCGYYGERLVMKAQELGLNTCWVGLTYGKGKCKAKVAKGEKLICVLALGYGANQGVPRKSRDITEVSNYTESMPKWFKDGIEGALLAPTAMNQQKFYFTLDGEKVSVKAGRGFYTKTDLGIVKYHFELATGRKL